MRATFKDESWVDQIVLFTFPSKGHVGHNMTRVLDIFFSGIAIILLIPFFFPIALILKLTGEGEVFFLQERVGRRGRKFLLIKFATMLKNSPQIGSRTITMKNDPRILPFGVILRKSKVNELPQLINILRGDMSLVGPRPLTLENFQSYDLDTQEIIKKVRPGLSGIGSIVFRGEEDIMHEQTASVEYYRSTIAPYKGQLENWYTSNNRIHIYFTVIILTMMAVVFPKINLIWRVLPSLPPPPDALKTQLGYSTDIAAHSE